MRVKIVARMRGRDDLTTSEDFEVDSVNSASQFHGDYWNRHFAWTDRFQSTMYVQNGQSLSWLKAETINW